MQIEFIPSSKRTENVIPHPKPAKNFLPDWYKDKKFFHGNDKNPLYNEGKVKNITLKGCTPFYDSMISGYIQETWCDIKISISGDSLEYHYASSPQIIDHRIGPPSMPIDEETFYPIEFLWKVHWMPKMPKGYSVMISQPNNRLDLPFFCPSGVIDSDRYFHSFPGNMPFYLKRNSNGFIPKGTPMYQILPIKREKWKLSTIDFNEDLIEKLSYERDNVFIGAYKRFFHNKKEYK